MNLQNFLLINRALIPLHSCTSWEAGPIFAFLIPVTRCFENGEGMTGLLLLSVDPDHTGAVVVVRSIAGTPRGLCVSLVKY